VNKEDFFGAWPARSRLLRDWAKERKLRMFPSISFETGGKHKLNLAGQSNLLRQPMEVWFYFE